VTKLFTPIKLRELVVKNRIWLPPMCQYSASDGLVGAWHLMHYGARAAGGFGLLIAEATAVSPEARISPRDAGLWNDAQVEAWRGVVAFVKSQGAAMAVQLAHAGRKASTYWPFSGADGSVPASDGGWQTMAPSAVAFPGYAAPREMTLEEIAEVPRQFADAARRADAAGFDAVEIHAAHGYLLHQFLSPLSNFRTDEYGGSAANRARLLLEVGTAVREAFAASKPVFVRVSATDWLPDGLQYDDVAEVVRRLGQLGIDLVDVSTGALLPAKIQVGPGYQLPAARRVKEVSGLPTAAVGLITEPAQAEQVLVAGDADVVLVGRAALHDPNWPLHAAEALGVAATDPAATWPPQYDRGL